MIINLTDVLRAQLEELYQDMEQAYDEVAEAVGLTCDGCPDNCCDSYFLHFTYVEWCYLWHGLTELPDSKQEEILKRAQDYERESEEVIAGGERPKLMCPLNEKGRCILYKHRLMVCRTHGVPAMLLRPDGKRLNFPGCFRCQEIVARNSRGEPQPVMERAPLLRRLVMLEQNLLGGKRALVPKVRLTIAGMITTGPPQVPHCSDRFNRKC